MYQVILADDEPVMRKALTTLVDWRALDCEVVAICSDGEQAQQALCIHKADILISDIQMPGKSGLELAEFVQKRAMHTRVVLLTAFADFAFAQQAVRFGVTEYVTKTGSMEGLAAVIEACKVRLALETIGSAAAGGRAQTFFRSVLDGSLYDPAHLCEEAESCGLSLNAYTVLCIDLPVAAEQTIDKIGKLLQSEFSRGYFLPMGPYRAYLAVCGPDNQLEQRCAKLAQTFFTLTQQMLYFGLSEVGSDVQALRNHFAQAEAALSGAFFAPHQTVHRYRNADCHCPSPREGAIAAFATRSSAQYHEKPHSKPFPRHSTETVHDISALLPQFSEVVELGNARSAQALLECFFEAQRACASPEQIRAEGALLLKVCCAQLERVGILSDFTEDITRWREALAATRSFADYKLLMHNVLRESCRATSQKLQTGGNVVQAARRYIDKNFQRQLTLSEIAAAVNVNPSYLSRVFKSKTGINLVDAINRNRMEKAKELLSLGHSKVYEVAALVGIEDTTYFSHLFRKYTGMSPRDYQGRQTVEQGEKDETATQATM